MMRNILVFYRNQYKRHANMFGLVVLLVVSALGVLSVDAFEGEMVGVELNQVTCMNTTTRATMPGNILPGGVYDCETVPVQSGDLVTVTIPTDKPPALLEDSQCFTYAGDLPECFGRSKHGEGALP